MENAGISVATLLRLKAEKLIANRPDHFTLNSTEGEVLKLLRELEVYSVELETQNEELLDASIDATGLNEKYRLSDNIKQRLLHEFEVNQVELEIQNQELLLSNIISKDIGERYSDLFNFSSSGYMILSKEGEILDLNFSMASLLGKERFNLKNSQFGFFVSVDNRPIFNNFLGDIFQYNSKLTCEVWLTLENSNSILVQLTGILTQQGDQCLMTLVDITERKQTYKYRELTREVLQVLNEPGDLKESIHRTLAVLKEKTGFDAVGIRLQEGNDFPYLDQLGFSTDFIQQENSLLVPDKKGNVCRDANGNVRLACTCGLVISGCADKKNPCMTPGGSWWTNDSFPLLNVPPGKDARYHPRNLCIHKGYASIALVPIRNKNKVVGLIQFNDFRKGVFNQNKIELLEGISMHIGEALMRKQAEDTLRKNEELLRSVTENAPDIIMQLDRLGTVLYVNRAFMGYSLEECTGKIFCTWTLPNYHEQMNQSLELVFDTCSTQTYLSQGNDKQGETRWYRTSISPVKEGQEVKNAVLITRDITESIVSEEILQESEQKLKAILTTAMDGFWISDCMGSILEVNDTYSRMIGYSRQELLTMRIHEVEAIENRAEIVRHIQKIQNQGEDRFETRHRCKDGHILELEIGVQYRKEQGGQFVAFMHDITERKKREESHRQSEERYKSLFQYNHSVMLLIHPTTGEIVDANPAACNYYGWSHSELCSKNISDINTLSKQEVAVEMQHAKEEQHNHFFFKHKLATDEMRDVEVYSGPIQFGEETLLYSLVHDITERNQISEALKISEEKFRNLVFEMEVGVLLNGPQTEILLANPKALELLGLTQDQITGKTPFDPDWNAIHEDGTPFPGDTHPAAQVIATGKPVKNVVMGVYQPLLGKHVWFLINAQPQLDATGKIIQVVTTFIDISELKQTQSELKESEMRLKYHFENSPLAVVEWDNNFKVTQWSIEAERMFGWKKEETIHKPIDQLNLIYEEDISIVNNTIKRLTSGLEDTVVSSNRNITKTGSVIHTTWYNSILFDSGGKMKSVMSLVQDVTFRKQAEEELRSSERRLDAVFNSVAETIMLVGKDGTVLAANRTASLRWGMTGDELIGINIFSLVPVEAIKRRKSQVQEMFTTGLPIQFEDSRDDREYDLTFYPIKETSGEIHQYVVFNRDITESKRVQEALRRNEEALLQSHSELERTVKRRTSELVKTNEALRFTEMKYRTVADFATNWEFWISPEDTMIYCSPSCERITGYTATEFQVNSQLIFNIIHPEDVPIYRDHKRKELQSQVCNHEIQYRIFKKDGTVRWIGHFCRPVFDEYGDFAGVRGSNKDITARKKMEELLTTSNQKYKLLSENINDGIFICKNGKFEYANKAMYDIFGYAGNELDRMKLTELVLTDYQEELENLLYTNETYNKSRNIEVECLRKDFITVFAEVFLNYVAKEKTVYGVVHDITEKKEFQKNMVKAIIQTEEKERSYFSKELHDGLGPLLSTIKLYLQWSERPNTSRSREEIVGKAGEILEEALATVKEISNKLSPHLLTNYGLNSAIKSFVEKLSATASYNIIFESNTARRIGAETEAALYRATIECINNTLKYANASKIHIRLEDTGNQIQLHYKDDGIGFNIPEAIAEHKGLGLFNLQNRLHTIGGKAEMTSKQGEGVNYLFTVNV